MGVLGELKILHDGPRSDDAVMQMVNTEAFKIFGSEVFEKFLTPRLLGKNPIIKFKSTQTGAEMLLKLLLLIPVVKHFLRRKISK